MSWLIAGKWRRRRRSIFCIKTLFKQFHLILTKPVTNKNHLRWSFVPSCQENGSRGKRMKNARARRRLISKEGLSSLLMLSVLTMLLLLPMLTMLLLLMLLLLMMLLILLSLSTPTSQRFDDNNACHKKRQDFFGILAPFFASYHFWNSLHFRTVSQALVLPRIDFLCIEILVLFIWLQILWFRPADLSH